MRFVRRLATGVLLAACGAAIAFFLIVSRVVGALVERAASDLFASGEAERDVRGGTLAEGESDAVEPSHTTLGLRDR